MDTNEYSPAPANGLAERIRAHRMAHGLTQRELAEQLGVTQQSVARWEQGSPPRRYLLRALDALLEEADDDHHLGELADVIGIRPTSPVPGRSRTMEEARRGYVQGCLKLLERGERLPNRVLLLLADELGWGTDDD